MGLASRFRKNKMKKARLPKSAFSAHFFFLLGVGECTRVHINRNHIIDNDRQLAL